MRRALLAPFLLTCTLSLAYQQHPHTRAALGSTHRSSDTTLTDQQKQLANTLCLDGMPEKTSTDLGPTEFIFRKGYVLEHSSLDKIPLWVCEHVTADQLGPDTNRSNKFKADEDLKGPHSTPADYARSGYDQGHQAPAANQGKNQELQDETFRMSNMAPQRPTMNRQAWRSLETLTRKWVTDNSEAYEITGPIFYDPKEDDRQTADGTITFLTIGKDAVAVPTHFYKIILVKDKDTGNWKSIAFVMPNIATYKSPYHLEQYIQSIRWIEQHTGLNFMPDLPAQQAQELEATASPMW
ncbi:DNA/RNA non-specific endonuclease [Granulicella sp. dw_53]|uniref:DNA/RNA non-specific endonuclease n=1 Tax=Granulicella sp. dw_53 TaxID=2719792 RepID=UPI001BD66B59|nr:DNA/RNA non-specific endonuclease [Granulicella sp. dw_53]